MSLFYLKINGMANFNIGDVVQLKSGGPEMTIVRDEGGGYLCTWFNGFKPEYATFPAEALEKVETSTDSGGIYIR